MSDKELPHALQCMKLLDCNYSESKSYADFKSVMDLICERYSPLNPFEGELFEYLESKTCPDGHTLDDTGMEFIRGGIIATVAAWERFVLNLFDEAFKILVKIGLGEPVSVENLKSLWPGCEDAIKKGKGIKDKYLYQNEDGKEEGEFLLDVYSKYVLECRCIQPIFLGRVPSEKEKIMCIDELFVQLFKIERDNPSLSKLVIKSGFFNYMMPCKEKGQPNYYDLHVKLKQTSDNDPEESTRAIKALNNISRLYYGLRCTLVHGKHKITLEQSLREFPTSLEDFHLPSACIHPDDIARYYIRLYKNIKEYGREAWVNYLTLLYVTRFYKTAAFSLMKAIAKWLCDNYISKTSFEDEIWGYKPRPRQCTQS